jgi:hypothetical protein
MSGFHLKDDWRYEVANGDTVLGFKEWCEHKEESDRYDREAADETTVQCFSCGKELPKREAVKHDHYEDASGDRIVDVGTIWTCKDCWPGKPQEENWPGEHKGISAMAGDNYVSEEDKEETQEKDFGEIVAELIAHGLNNEDIFEQLVNGYGYLNKAPEYLIGLLRQKMTDAAPFSHDDLVTYLEIAQMHVYVEAEAIKTHLDVTDEEYERLRDQLEAYMQKEDSDA